MPGFTALDYCCEQFKSKNKKKNRAICEYLRSHGAKCYSLYYPTNFVQHEVEIEDFYYANALHIEVRNKDIERVKVLLQANKHEINKMYCGGRECVLDLAISKNHVEMAELLRSSGA